MADRKRMRLTDAAIARLRPREREYTLWDSRVPGLGVRVRPTGARTFVMLRDVGGESRRVSLGPVSTMGIAEARKECLARQAVPEPDRETAPKRAVPLLREFIEGEWKEAHFDRYKPSTRKSVHYLLSGRILPEFGSKKLDRVTGAQLARWFDTFSRTAPGNANHALALLRQIMNFAIACGYIERNPTQGIRPNRRPRLTRFLSREEIGRLHRVLDAQTGENNRQQADVIRLLLLTGCRKGEILRLRWSEVHRDALFLADSKTGARKVPLNSQARSILERQPRDASPFVFPSLRNPGRPYSDNLALWYRVRREAGIEDVRPRQRTPSRPPSYPCEPRGDERRSGAGRLADARSLQRPHDAALRPSRRPGNRGCRRTDRAIGRSHHGHVSAQKWRLPGPQNCASR